MRLLVIIALLLINSCSLTRKQKSNESETRSSTIVFKDKQGRINTVQVDGKQSAYKHVLSQCLHNSVEKENTSEEKSYTIMLTAVPQETLGDASAASKFMNAVTGSPQYTDASPSFIWIIEGGAAKETIHKLIPRNSCLFQLSRWSDVINEDYQELFDNAELVLSFPSFHHFSEEQTQFLANGIQAKYVRFTEYDFFRSIPFPEKPVIRSGFCKSCEGIFIKQSETRELIEEGFDDNDQYLFDFLNSTDEHQLYFAYFNKMLDMVDENSGVDRASFALLAILKEVYANPDRLLNMNIVMPFLPSLKDTLSKRIRTLLPTDERPKNRPISLFFLQKNRLQEGMEANVTEGNVIRFINPFPLANKTMLTLMAASDPFMGATGDQSFSEALSLAKITMYQTMEWKTDLYKNFINYGQNFWGKNYKLIRFYRGFFQGKRSDEDLKQMARDVSTNIDSWQVDMVNLRDHIYEHKNLEQGLIEAYFRLLSSSSL